MEFYIAIWRIYVASFRLRNANFENVVYETTMRQRQRTFQQVVNPNMRTNEIESTILKLRKTFIYIVVHVYVFHSSKTDNENTPVTVILFVD